MKPKNDRTGWGRMGTALSLTGMLLGSTACHTETPAPPTPTTVSDSAQKGLEILGFDLDVSGLSVAEKEQIGRGSYLVNAVGDCSSCHDYNTPTGPKYLGGGSAFDIGSGAVIYGRNLTSDPSTGMQLTEDQFVETMRTGKDFAKQAAGEALIIMPWLSYRWMSTDDLKAMYAFLKKVPAVKNSVPEDIKGAAGAARPITFPTSTFTDGAVAHPLPSEEGEYPNYPNRGLAIHPLADPPALAGFSTEDREKYGRGSYLVNAVAECNGCHTNPDRSTAPDATFGKVNTAVWMTGGEVLDVPPGLNALSGYSRTMAANLLGSTHGRLPKTYDVFKDIITSGKVAGPEPRRALGFPMNGSAAAYAKMLEGDLQSVYFYLSSQTRLSGSADKATQEPATFCKADADCASHGGGTCSIGAPTGINQCVSASCTQDSDCGACQACTSGKCTAPASSSTCPVSGI